MFLPVLFLPSDFFTSELCLLTFSFSLISSECLDYPFLLEIIKDKILHILHLGPPPTTLLSELLTEPGIRWPGIVTRFRP